MTVLICPDSLIYLRAILQKCFFKSVYGVTIYSYIKTMKMRSAARRLIEDGTLGSGYGGQYGYDNASKFASAFKQVMGISPAEYRRLGFLRAAE